MADVPEGVQRWTAKRRARSRREDPRMITVGPHSSGPPQSAVDGREPDRQALTAAKVAQDGFGAGGLASLSSALEQSNVQIAQEFIDLIRTRRPFQAAARVITASDTLLGDLINIIR